MHSSRYNNKCTPKIEVPKYMGRRSTSTPFMSPKRDVSFLSSTRLTPNIGNSTRYSLLSDSKSARRTITRESYRRTHKLGTGPLLASTRFNVNLGTYTDVKSPGLTSRIVQYNNEKERNQFATPTHQKKYGSPGLFPIVHFFKKDVPVSDIKKQTKMDVRRPSISESYSVSPVGNRIDNGLQEHQTLQQDEPDISTRSVLDALKEISRKRIHGGDDYESEQDMIKRTKRLEYNMTEYSKRNREDSPPPTNITISPSNQISKRICVVDPVYASTTSSSYQIFFELGHKRKAGRLSNEILVSETEKKQKVLTNAETQTLEVQPKAIVTTHKATETVTSPQISIDETPNPTVEPPQERVPVFDEKKYELQKKNKLASLLSAITHEDARFITQEIIDRNRLVSILSPQNKAKHDKHVRFDFDSNGTTTTDSCAPVVSISTETLPSTQNSNIFAAVNNIPKSITTPLPAVQLNFNSTPLNNTNTEQSKLSNFASIEQQIPATPPKVSTGGFKFNLSPPVTTSAPITQAPIKSSTINSPSMGFPIISQSVSKTTAAPTFSFGATPAATPSTNSSFTFGSSAKPIASNHDSNFSMIPTTGTLSANLAPVTANQSELSAPLFGLTSTAPVSNSFAVTDTTASSPFNKSLSFGTATSAPTFGAATSPTTTFGAVTSVVPTFGTATNALTTFGAASTAGATFGAATSAAPTFGAATSVAPTFVAASSVGSTFGVATSAVPTFGAATSAAPTFGAVTSASAFKSASVAPTFGSATSAPIFGAVTVASTLGTATNTPYFGAATGAQTFGSASGQTFGASASTPSFGALTSIPSFGEVTTKDMFGAKTTTASSFGLAMPTPVATAAPSFGGTPTATALTFGATSTTTSSGFGSVSSTTSFGAPKTAASTFGSTTSTFGSPSVAPPAYGAGATKTNTPFTNFGTPATAAPTFGTPTTTTSTFGNSSTTFGNPAAPPPAYSASTSTPLFGTPTTTSAPAFGAGSMFSTSGSSFGAAVTTTPVFGTATTTSAPMFAFGNGSASTFGKTAGFKATTSTTSSAFNFGGSAQPPAYSSTSQATSFGAPTNQTSPFGAPANQVPAFGSPNVQSPAFGTATTQSSAFGTTTTQSSAFGTPTTQSSAFGTPTTQSSTFGTPQQSAFGTSTAPTFGAKTSSSVFGATNTPTFGSTSIGAFGDKGQSTFGASAPAPGFGSAPTAFGNTTALPAFGNTATNSFSSNTFGGASAFGGANGDFAKSSNNAFGANNTAAPAFETGAAQPSFGGFNNNQPNVSAPSTGGVFAFGSGNIAAQSPPKAGGVFSFGNEAPKTNSFNFSGGAPAAPVASFGSLTPSFGTPNFGAAQTTNNNFNAAIAPQFNSPSGGMFSIGSGASARPRTQLKAKRRT